MHRTLLPADPRILCVKLADIGDVLLCTPALRALRARYPGARIDLLTPPSSAAVLRAAPEIDEVLVFNKFPFDTLGSLFDLSTVLRAIRFLWGLGRRHYDALLIFHHYSLRFGALKFAAVALASRAPLRAGVDNGRGWFLTHRLADGGFGAQHEAEYWLDVAALAGAERRPADRRLMIPIGAADHAAAAALLAERGLPGPGPLIAIHPGAGWYSTARRWPAAHFATLINMLVQERHADIVLLGGPDEQELTASIREMVAAAARAHVHNIAGQTSITGTAALLQRCRLFIGNDSGPLHIATAAGIPVLAIFGLSNWRAYGPYVPPHPATGTRQPAQIVRQDLPCMPCLYRGQDLGLRDGCGPRPCLTALTPAHVVRAARDMLDMRAGVP
ncbi:MAG TPA: glycosyltransferase family 9 protein [Chloroflexia bacterium]|nr:glycosyltransferase family 9 protein [Chloroflexia bacterium]